MPKILLCLLILLSSTTVLAQTVYKTPSGKKYHTATCRYVKNVSQKITIAKAQRIGLDACSQCNPNEQQIKGLVSTKASPNSRLGIKPDEAKGTLTTSVQCKGRTKAKARCKRKTKNVNGYCFQHEG